MPVYDPILETETDPDQPLKSSLAKRWSNNWIAGFEGEVGAPRIAPPAFGQMTLGETLCGYISPPLNLVIGSYSASTTASGSIDTAYLSSLGVHTMLNAGAIRIRGITSIISGSFGTHGLRIYRNGVLLTVVAGDFLYDMSVAAFDEIHFGVQGSWSTGSGGGAGQYGINSLRVNGALPRLWRY